MTYGLKPTTENGGDRYEATRYGIIRHGITESKVNLCMALQLNILLRQDMLDTGRSKQ